MSSSTWVEPANKVCAGYDEVDWVQRKCKCGWLIEAHRSFCTVCGFFHPSNGVCNINTKRYAVSKVVNCRLSARPGETLFTVRTDGTWAANLDGYTVMPNEEYDQLIAGFMGIVPIPSPVTDTKPLPVTIKCPSCFVQQPLSESELPEHRLMTIACGCRVATDELRKRIRSANG